MTRKSSLQYQSLLATTLAAWLCNALLGVACAAEPAKVTPLMKKDVAGAADKEVLMSTVEYLPGGASMPHRHDANVFVYVLEGSLIMQVDGHEVVTLKPGDTFYEGPDDIHRVSANASKTEPVKFLVFMVKDKDKPPTRPVN
ncbi:MAG TPA: cupin domain-containing protein [Steroidobacteraceae bacterium]|nr:cupin domain-containing protein [Steroidobacteraceae bacterium]